jgi:hypothetical protein
MRRYKTAAKILFLLSIVNVVLTAPIVARESHQVRAGAIEVAKDATAPSEKRYGSDDETDPGFSTSPSSPYGSSRYMDASSTFDDSDDEEDSFSTAPSSPSRYSSAPGSVPAPGSEPGSVSSHSSSSMPNLVDATPPQSEHGPPSAPGSGSGSPHSYATPPESGPQPGSSHSSPEPSGLNEKEPEYESDSDSSSMPSWVHQSPPASQPELSHSWSMPTWDYKAGPSSEVEFGSTSPLPSWVHGKAVSGAGGTADGYESDSSSTASWVHAEAPPPGPDPQPSRPPLSDPGPSRPPGSYPGPPRLLGSESGALSHFSSVKSYPDYPPIRTPSGTPSESESWSSHPTVPDSPSPPTTPWHEAYRWMYPPPRRPSSWMPSSSEGSDSDEHSTASDASSQNGLSDALKHKMKKYAIVGLALGATAGITYGVEKEITHWQAKSSQSYVLPLPSPLLPSQRIILTCKFS